MSKCAICHKPISNIKLTCDSNKCRKIYKSERALMKQWKQSDFGRISINDEDDLEDFDYLDALGEDYVR